MFEEGRAKCGEAFFIFSTIEGFQALQELPTMLVMKQVTITPSLWKREVGLAPIPCKP